MVREAGVELRTHCSHQGEQRLCDQKGQTDRRCLLHAQQTLSHVAASAPAGRGKHALSRGRLAGRAAVIGGRCANLALLFGGAYLEKFEGGMWLG